MSNMWEPDNSGIVCGVTVRIHGVASVEMTRWFVSCVRGARSWLPSSRLFFEGVHNYLHATADERGVDSGI